jgi:hypothetical protein
MHTKFILDNENTSSTKRNEGVECTVASTLYSYQLALVPNHENEKHRDLVAKETYGHTTFEGDGGQ